MCFIAAGSDVGLIIFKLEKERVSNFKARGNRVFCVHKKMLKMFEDEKETLITTITTPGKSVLNNNPKYILVNVHAQNEC